MTPETTRPIELEAFPLSDIRIVDGKLQLSPKLWDTVELFLGHRPHTDSPTEFIAAIDTVTSMLAPGSDLSSEHGQAAFIRTLELAALKSAIETRLAGPELQAFDQAAAAAMQAALPRRKPRFH